ncbi:M28 family metallopeptidase [uncultured Clostridium sp.]|uniref:M28 family metallopeptidase n=1 Tax=uncultured Clostridium sp. TaxID=59620 RepID=UPI00262E0A14|nr:M28 family metallopeptidase [uncultured Clostridium sp.]
MHNSKIAFSVALTKKTYESILESIQTGKTLYCKLPYSTKLTEVFNVVGKIKGTDSSKSPLILSAHFDHLGTDCLNNIYCGALDNASGACFLLELAKVFSSINLKPERDIIFVFLNAEEFGLLGSEEFSKKYSDIVEGSQIINIDMIGSPSETLSLVRSEHLKEVPSDNLNSLIKLNKSTLSIKYENSSDHTSFNKYGGDSLTVTNDDSSRIHTPNDREEFISTKSLDDGFNLLNKKIIQYCYSPFKRAILNNIFYLLSFSICLSYIFYKNIIFIKKKKSNF